VTESRCRQHNDIEALLATQQRFNKVHDIFPYIHDVLVTSLLARQLQPVTIRLNMQHRGTRRQRLGCHIAVASKKIQDGHVFEVITTLDALADPACTENIPSARANTTAGIEAADDTHLTQFHGPLPVESAAGRLPVTALPDLININPVGLPRLLAARCYSTPIQRLDDIRAPALQLAAMAEIDQFVVITRRFHQRVAGGGFRNARKLDH
jgi:hypothetical protein